MEKTYEYTIKTSGYSDRYLYCELHITDQEASFRDAEGYAAYKHRTTGADYETAWNEAYHANATHIMTGKTSPRRWCTIQLSQDDRRSINAYLMLKTGKPSSYTAEAIQRSTEQLKKHPLTGDLLEIVKWQLRQCELSNIETYGNANGQESNWQ